MYDRIEAELKGVQQAIYSSRAVSTAPSSSEGVELGDEPTQLRRISRCNRDSTSSSPGRKGEGHRGLEARKGGGLRETSGCTQETDDLRRSSKKTRRKSRKRKTSCSQSRLGLERQ
jgi:hypothetical protein